MIEREVRGPVTLLRLAHGKANLFDLELLAALDRSLAELESAPPGGVVIAGAGSIFSAGVDLKRVVAGGAGYVARFLPLFGATLERLVRLPRPVVAAINGHAVAGGLVFACACDHRLMAAGEGRVGLSELVVGVPFPFLAFEAVRLVAGDRAARGLVFSGGMLGPEEALRSGWVDGVAPAEELLDRAVDRAAALAEIPHPTFGLAKRQLWGPVLERLESRGRAHDAEVLASWSSPEIVTAVRRFVATRLGAGR